MTAYEANFDGLVGPTHNYGGLSFGNVASAKHQAQPSNPKLAAKQGLAKMKALADLGFVQGVLAPQARPDIPTLRRLGFRGSDQQVIAQAAQHAPQILAACSSASSMWTANAATVSPSADTADGKVHFTPANLINKFHRAIEHDVTGRILKASLRMMRILFIMPRYRLLSTLVMKGRPTTPVFAMNTVSKGLSSLCMDDMLLMAVFLRPHAIRPVTPLKPVKRSRVYISWMRNTWCTRSKTLK